MTVESFCLNLPNLPLRTNDRIWFPKWIRRYASSLQCAKNQPLVVSEHVVLRFLKSLRDNGVPAWQRYQAVRAVEAYRQHILNTNQPSLVKFKQALHRLAARERDATSGALVFQEAPEMLCGLPRDEPEVLQRLRVELRRLDYKFRTEKAYVGWVKRFIQHCKSPHLDKFGEADWGTRM